MKPTPNEKLLQAQLHDLRRQLNQSWRALRFFTNMDHGEAIERYEALARSTAFQIAKDDGLDSIDEAMPRALEVLGVI